MQDFMVWTNAFHRQYPDKLSQDGVFETTASLVRFLAEKQLLAREVSEAELQQPDFELHMRDLTQTGRNLIMDGLDRWLRANDDITKPIRMTSLERAYKRLVKAGG